MSDSVNRRDFVKSAAGVAAGLGLAANALRAQTGRTVTGRVVGANDRINVAIIGGGMRGPQDARSFMKAGADMNAQIAAVCDVYQRRLTQHKTLYKCDGYLDHREILNRKDMDAVIIATPDHWHAKIAFAAMDDGKDVYLEKPMCHTIDEARQLIDTVKETQARSAGRLANDVGAAVVEGEEGHRGRRHRRHDHEPGLLSPQLQRRRVELADRPRQPVRIRRARTTSTGRPGSARRPSAPGMRTGSSASASTGITPAASRRTCSSTLPRR